MNFKNWREAEKRAGELKTSIDAIAKKIAASELEARKEDITVETRESLITALSDDVTARDRLQSEYDDTIAKKDELKQAEERQFGLLANLSVPRVNTRLERIADKNIYETREYELAWANYIRSQNETEIRSLLNTQDSGHAGILVPHTLVNKIEDTMSNGGRIVNLCSVTNMKGISEYPIIESKTDPELHNEKSENPKKEKEITVASVKMEPQFIAETLQVTRKFEMDSIEAFWEWLVAELPDALLRAVDDKILNGGQEASAGVHGILTNTDTKFVATLSDHALNFNTANQSVALLDDGVDNDVTIVMNRRTFYDTIQGMKGTDDHPIFNSASELLNTRVVPMLRGYPVVFSNILPNYESAQAGQTYMVAGNFKAYKLNFPEGKLSRILRDEYSGQKHNLIHYRSEIYVAGNITRLKNFVKVTK